MKPSQDQPQANEQPQVELFESLTPEEILEQREKLNSSEST